MMETSNRTTRRIAAAAVLAAGIWGVLAAAAAGQETETGPEIEIAFGTEVDRETRTLVGQATEFPTGLERIFCLTRIVGMSTPAAVTHAWYYQGKTMARVDLKVGSADWRTWSSKRYLPAWTGPWEVKVLDGEGRVLAAAGFEIREPAGEGP